MDLSDLNVIISKINLSIQSEDRKKRKQVLSELSPLFKEIENDEAKFVSTFESFLQLFVRCLNDPAESVRDSCIDILQGLIVKLPFNNRYLDDIIPVLLFRLGNEDLNEASEEIRLKYVELLSTIIETYLHNIDVYVADIISILTNTLIDSYPKVRQKSADCCKVVVKKGGTHVYENSYKLVKPLLAGFKQKHSRTRITAIEALCDVLKEGNWKFLEAQEIFGSLGERLFDPTPGVRLAVVELLGTWLLHMRERYSFFSRMVPLILSCLSDDQPDVRARAWVVWSAAGKQYASENEQDLKDKMDFLDEKPVHYPGEVERPNIGCRTLVQRNTIQMMTPLLRELDDWKVEIRVKGSSLLVMIALHAEEEITQHTEYIFKSMYSLAEKEDPPIVVANVEKAAEYMAHFLETNTWFQLIYPVLEDGVRIGHLRILSALCRGTKSGGLDEYKERLAVVLSDKGVCTMREELYQTQLLKCCYAILNNATALDETALKNLYMTVTFTAALSNEGGSVANASEGVLKALAAKQGVSVATLACNHINSVIETCRGSTQHWTSVHSDLALLLYILKQPATVWYSAIEDVIELLKIVLSPDRDAKMRSQLFIQLSKILTESDPAYSCEKESYSNFLLSIIRDMICPNLIWKAGRTSEALRTTVLACLFHVLAFEEAWKKIPADEVTKALLPPLIDCLRDQAPETRTLALKNISSIVWLAHEQHCLVNEHINAFYNEVLGRLDDVSNDVRSEAVSCLHNTYKHLPEKYTQEDYRYHFETLIQTMLTHLDDPDEAFQNSLLDALKMVANRAPAATREKLEARRHLFKSQNLCDQLLQHLETLSSSSNK